MASKWTIPPKVASPPCVQPLGTNPSETLPSRRPDIVQKITDMAQAFGNMSQSKSIVKAAAFLAAIGHIASIGGGVTRVVLNLSKARSSPPKFTASMRVQTNGIIVGHDAP